MKLFRWAGAVLLGVLPAVAVAATSTVTATVTDTDGQVWSNGSWNAKILMPGGQFAGTAPTIGGIAIPTSINGVMNASGVLTASLTDTSTLDQTGVQWTISVCPNASISPYGTTTCFAYTGPIVGANVSLTSRFSSVTAPRFPAGQQAFGYLDTEVFPPAQPGLSYFNTNTNLTLAGLRLWDGNRWVSGGGGGGGAPTGPAGGRLSGTYPNPTLANSGISTSACGDALNVCQTTFNADGTAATAVPVPIGTNYIQTSLLGAYNFTQTGVIAGGSLLDVSGNGNNCTVGSTPPTQDGFGWRGTATANNGTVCPTALNAARTFYFAVYDPPPLLGGYTANNEVYIGSTQAGGLNIVGFTCCSLYNQQYYVLWQFNAGSTTGTTTAQYRNGFSFWTLVCSATPVMYLNGVALAASAYNSRVACQTQVAPNQFQFFASQSFPGGSNATFYKAMFYSTQHTAAQVQQNYAAMLNVLTARGAPVRPFPYRYTIPQGFLVGDSIAWGAGLTPASTNQPDPYTPGTASTQTWFNRMTLTGTFGLTNFGVPSAAAYQQNVRADTLYAPLCSTQTSQSFGIFHEGTNDFALNTGTPQQVYDRALSWKTKMQAAGCKAIIRAMLSRTGANCGGGANPSCDTYKSQFDGIIRARWIPDGWDDYIDDEPFTDRGINGSYATWGTDGVHPPTGIHGAMATQASDHLNWLYFGSTPRNPNPTVVTSTTYSSTVLDGGLNFDLSGGNITDTLFSATGWSGRIIKRCNIAAAGSNTLTVTAPGDFPFNNRSGLTTVVLNPSSCASFQSAFISFTTGGNFWSTN